MNGKLAPGVYAKDVILHIIRILGTNGGTGFAYEYGGDVFNGFSMEERMTVCNMSIEGGARVGYVNPDATTLNTSKRKYCPKDSDFDRAVERWKNFASDNDCQYDDIVAIDANEIQPTVTWGITPGQGIGIDECIPTIESGETQSARASISEAFEHMSFEGALN